MKIEIDTDTFEFAYDNKEFLKLVGSLNKMIKGEPLDVDREELLKNSQRERAENDFRTRAWKFYCGIE